MVGVLVAATAATGAGGKDVDGVLRWFVTEQRQSGIRTDAYGGTVDVRYNRRVGPIFSYLLSTRYTTTRQELFSLPPLEDSTSRQLEPRLELRLVPRKFELSIGDRWRRSWDSISSAEETARTENNLFGRFRTTMEKLPEFLVEFDRRDESGDLTNDRDSTRLLGQVAYTGAGWSASAGRRRTVTDTEGVLRRTVDENLLAASVNRSLADNRLTLFASFNVNDLTGRDRLARQSLVPIPRGIRQGLLALDTTPLDGALTATPALVDGNRSTPTGANIGGSLSGGSTNWNIGVELALDETVDVIDLWLADPIPADSAARYQFDVYRSDDNAIWTRVGTAARTYDPFEGRFRLTFPSVRVRFVKVLNTTIDDALGAVFVSEIEIFGRELRQGTTRSGTRTENAAANLSWSPRDDLSLTLGGYRNKIESETGRQTTSSEDTSGTLTVSVQPSSVLLGSVSLLSNRRERSQTPTEEERRIGLTLTALPFEDLDLTVVANLRDRERAGITAESGSFLFRAAALLYRDLSVSAAYGRAHEENFDTPTRERETWQAALNARPRAEIELNSSLLRERLVTLALAPAETVQKIVNWQNRLTLRPSSILGVTLQGTYLRLEDETGWSRVVQADWSPFPGGAFQFSVDFREDSPLGGQERRVRAVRLRWNLNRQMFLDLDASRRRVVQPDGVEQASTALSAFFQGRF